MVLIMNKKIHDLEFLLEISKSDLKQAITDLKRENQKSDEEYESLKNIQID